MGISKPGTKGIPSSLAFQGKPASGIVNKCPSKGIQLNTDKVANKIYVDSQPFILYMCIIWELAKFKAGVEDVYI